MLFETGSGLARISGGASGLTSLDMGVPLDTYMPAPVDPLQIWKTQPSVRKVVGFAARQIAQLPWHAFERVGDTDRERVSDSGAERALSEPSRFVSGYQLIEQLVIDLLMYDRFCALWVDGELIRLPPKRWTVKADWLGRAYQIRLFTPVGEKDIDLTDAPIAVGWGWADINAGGVSPMFTLSQILDESRKSVEWRNRLWEDAPKFSGILKHPATFKDPKKREGFVQSWAQWRDTRKGTPILEEGMEYEVPEMMSPKDARDIEGRALTDIEVTSAYHIPPELTGARPGNFSNMQAFRSMLFGPTLGPTITQLQQAFKPLTPIMDGTERPIYLEVGREAAINGSLIEQAAVLQTMTGAPIMLRAEARGKINLPFIEGTDELIVPMNVTEGGQASPTDSGSQNRTLGLKSLTLPRTVVKAGGEVSDKEADKLRARIERALSRILDDQEDDSSTGDEFRDKWVPVTAAELLPGVTAAAGLSAGRVAAAAGAEFDAAVMDAYLAKMADTTASQITDGTAEAIAESDDRSTTFETLRDSVAVAWAGSVVAQSMGFGGHDAARATGGKTKTWNTNSGNPRPSHAAMNGETVGVDDTFSNGAMWPGDVALSADEAAGCQCSVTYSW